MATRIIRGTQTVTDYNQAGESALVATLTASGTTLANNFVIYNTDIPAIRIWNGTAFQNLTQPTIDDVPTLNNVRTTPVRVATFGDSTANFYSSGTGVHDNTVLTAPFPASGATVLGVNSDKLALPQRYPMTYMVGNGGISGQTTTQMIARDTASASTTRRAITDIIDLKPDVVLLRGGSINDLTAVTSGTLAAVVTATYNNHILIIQRFLAAGIPVIDSGVYGYNGTATDLTSTRSAIVQLNALFLTYAQSYPGRIFFINFTNLLNDGTGVYLTGVYNLSDGTHLNQQGQVIAAKQEAIAMTSLFGKSNASRFVGPNIITNSLMANTGAQAYGTVATGFGITAANTTRANAKVEMIDGRVWQTVEITVTAISANGSITMPYTPNTMGIAVNDIYGFEFDFFVAGMAGAAPPIPNANGVLGRVDTYKTAAGRVVLDALSTSTQTQFLDPSYMGHCVIGPVQFQEPSANLTASSTFAFTYSTDQLVTFKMGVSMPRIVKLGTTDAPTSFLTSGNIPVAISSGGMKSGILADNGDVLKQTYLSGAIAQLPGVLYTQTVSTTVTNTVTETTILGAGLGYGRTLPVNFWNIVGKTIRLRVGGVYTTPVATTPSLIIKIKYGTIIVATITTTGLLAGATNLRFDGEVFLTCQSTGATGTLVAHGDIQYAAGVAGQVLFDPLNNAGAAATINTTTANLIDITVQWDAASTTRSATSTVAILEVLN